MKKIMNGLYGFSYRFIQIVGLFVTAFLFASAFLRTCYTTDMETQLVLTRWDNPLYNLAGMGAFLLFFGLIWHLISANPVKRRRLLLLLTLFWCVGIGMCILFFGRTMPSADCMSVFSMAEELASGNTAVIHPTDSYISYYPQQIGLIAFYEIIVRIWNVLPFGMRAFPAIQALNILLACVIIFTQYKTVHLLWNSDRADCLYLLLAGCNLPLLMYTSFVYGELPSFAALSVGLYFLLKILAGREDGAGNIKQSVLCAIISLLCLSFSVMLRKNSLILIIAVVIVVLLYALRERSTLLLLYGLLCIVCALSVLPLLQNIYEYRSGNSINSGVPAVSYFAMGMQESSRACGWYNGFNFNTYQDSGMDTELTTQISCQAISDRLSYFRDNPGYALHFYNNKYLSQWADGSYACRQATYATTGERTDWMWSFYSGLGAALLTSYCNIYQNLLYLGVLLFFLFMGIPRLLPADLTNRTKEDAGRLYVYLGFIGVLGGFLFHMIWEANARYIFLYGLLLLPYTARGLDNLSTIYEKLPAKKKKGIGILLAALLVVSLTLTGIGVWKGADSKAKKAQLERLGQENYQGMFCAMYSLEHFKEDDFATYRGIPAVIVKEPAQDSEDISDYLNAAFSSDNTITNIYLGLDPGALGTSDQTEYILSYFDTYPDTSFEILLPCYSIQHWTEEGDDVSEQTFDSYLFWVQSLQRYPNVTVYFPGAEPWLISNPDNYAEKDVLSETISHKLLLLTFCDRNYALTSDNTADCIHTFAEYIMKERTSPTTYPGLGDWDIVFFGDSIIGNYTTSDSIPGVVSALSHARTYNCAKGGTAATFTDPEVLCFSTSIDYFAEQNTEAVADYDPFSTSLQHFMQDDHSNRGLLFVINYGLNDYFDGYPVDNGESPFDTGSYAGALRDGIQKLQELYPQAQILLMAPNFTSYFTNGTEVTSEKSGILTDYVNATLEVAKERNILSLDKYHDLGIDESNEEIYLSDGCHFNEKGRFLVAERILALLAHQ